MTTAWAHFAQGRPAEALRANATGTLLAIVALGVALGALIVAVRGRRVSWQPGQRMIAGLAASLAGAVLLEWAFRLLAG